MNGRSSSRAGGCPTSRNAQREGVTAASSAVDKATRPAPAPAGSPLRRAAAAKEDAGAAFIDALAWSNQAVMLCPLSERFGDDDIEMIVGEGARKLRLQLELILVVNRCRDRGALDALCRRYVDKASREARSIVDYRLAYVRDAITTEKTILLEVSI